MESMPFPLNHPELLVTVGAALVVAVLLLRLLAGSVVYIANTEYGILERKWSWGRRSRDLIALDGSAGFVPEVLRGGWHLLMPFQYRVHRRPLIRVDQMAYLVARVGAPLDEGQALGRWPTRKGAEGIEPDARAWASPVNPQDVRAFLTCGGQRGLQRHVLRTGTYAINVACLAVITAEGIQDVQRDMSAEDRAIVTLLKQRSGFDPLVVDNNTIGVVTVQDGPALAHGEIIAPTVGADASDPATFHNSFQDIPRFLEAGGRRGRQEQVLVDGTYYISRLFATIELCQKTKVGIGTVGVVNSYVGTEVTDALSGDQGRGRTVERGRRGIWDRPLEPGMYALNQYALEVTHVPTTNFSLRWEADAVSRLADARAASNRVSFDDDLREIQLISRDGFEFLLPLAMVAHISPMSAPPVIPRFSQVTRFVTQMLDPMVASFFRDSAQERTLLDFVSQRTEIGRAALAHVRAALVPHRIDVEEVIVGTPRDLADKTVVEQLFNQLRDRQTAEQQSLTFVEQGRAAEVQRALNEKRALAEQQPALTASHVRIQVLTNEGDAEAARRAAEAMGIRVSAEAEAYAVEVRGAAEAKSNTLIAESLGGASSLLMQQLADRLRDAVTGANQPLVPTTLVALGAEGLLQHARELIARAHN